MLTAYSVFIVAIISYPLFWLHTFNPNYRVGIFIKNNLDSKNEFATDTPPSLLSGAAIFWALLFGFVYRYFPENWSTNGSNLGGLSLILGLACVAITGKIYVGAIAENHKRVLFDGTKITRPIKWRIVDILTAIPVNLTVTPLNKLLWLPVFGLIAWLLHPLNIHASVIVPDYVFLAGAMFVLGRLSSMYINRKAIPLDVSMGHSSKHHYQGLKLFLISAFCISSFVVTTSLVDAILQKSGFSTENLPSYSLLLAGLSGIPLITVTGEFISAIFAEIFERVGFG
ncbi:hypothetical protein LRS11_19520 [Pseudomonas sp. J452]|uniref:hypothetical protein n=1 Tax=Pseudomonas sp. J452 TaxID=2898441 RepID=UPI0021AE06FC|nr:hypothetical protein [Pseudomonas sp. J452]UUY07973.1 hypothetical protein LRS11_19520 [Pseudomonas sp. J452]